MTLRAAKDWLALAVALLTLCGAAVGYGALQQRVTELETDVANLEALKSSVTGLTTEVRILLDRDARRGGGGPAAPPPPTPPGPEEPDVKESPDTEKLTREVDDLTERLRRRRKHEGRSK